MPRISQRRILIEWCLEGIERDKVHLQSESLSRFCDWQKVVLRERVRQLITDKEEVREEDDLTVTVSCSVSLSDSESGR